MTPKLLSEEELIDLAHSQLIFNAPLGVYRAGDLIQRAVHRLDGEVLDIGCGDGRFLLDALSVRPLCSGSGIDLNSRAIARATAAAMRRGLAERVTFHTGDIAEWTNPADTVICVGTAHAWPDRPAAFRDLLRRVLPGGRLLYGDGFWRAPPSPAAVGILGELSSLADLVTCAAEQGWRPLHVSESTLDELDTWESDWRAGLELSGNQQARALADERRDEYFNVYRGLFGFAWMVLTPA